MTDVKFNVTEYRTLALLAEQTPPLTQLAFIKYKCNYSAKKLKKK